MTYNGLTRATNDVGIITLPDGTHVAIFISDFKDSQRKQEMPMAQAAKSTHDYWTIKFYYTISSVVNFGGILKKDFKKIISAT